MKKLEKNLLLKLKRPHLYRDDLILIENIFKEDSSVEKFNIKFNDCEYDSFNEIPENEKSVNYIKISSYNPYIYIELTKTSSNIYVSNIEDTKIRGIFSKIQDILKQTERKVLWIFSGSILGNTFIPIVVFGVSFGLLSKVIKNEKYSLVIGLIVYIFWAICSGYSSLKFYSKVDFSFKKNKSSFWIRKKDEVLVAVLAAFAGAFIGSILTLIVQYLVKSIN